MTNEQHIEAKGTVSKARGNSNFLVKISEEEGGMGGKEIPCTISGKIRGHFIRVIEGDVVTVRMSIYDMTKGVITYIHKNKPKRVFNKKRK